MLFDKGLEYLLVQTEKQIVKSKIISLCLVLTFLSLSILAAVNNGFSVSAESRSAGYHLARKWR